MRGWFVFAHNEIPVVPSVQNHTHGTEKGTVISLHKIVRGEM
jgi:hypothetical protein